MEGETKPATEVPKSIAVREATFGGVRLRMHYLDNGQRVIEASGMDALMRAMQAGSLKPRDAAAAAAWSKGDA